MKAPGRNVTFRQRGFTLLEILIVTAILFVIGAITVPVYRHALVKTHIQSVGAEARTLHTSFRQHFRAHGGYPSVRNNPSFDLATMEPLRAKGYYGGNVTDLLLNGRADAFDSPDDLGPNQEFWLEMTLASDPSIRIVVADSDDAPLGGGAWLDGVFIFRKGVLKPL
jgi:prepilin-type N-terminal cleavage/methylation domain-containing protein